MCVEPSVPSHNPVPCSASPSPLQKGMSAVPTRPLGSQGLVVPRIGFGAMGCTAFYTTDPAAIEADALAAIDELVLLSAPSPAFIDTAFIYAHPSGAHNETLVGKAIAKHGRDKFVLATKMGVAFPSFTFDSSPAAIRGQLAESLKRLGTNYVDLYYQHRVDPKTPMETVAATFKELHAEGLIRYAGLSECTPDELRRAHAVFPISAVQLEYSLQSRDIEPALLPAARELGVGLVAYSPLGRGLLSGSFSSRADLADGDWRLLQPRFSEDRIAANAAKAAALKDIATGLGVTPGQLALAWLLSRGDDVFPIPGTKSAARVRENMEAAGLVDRITPEVAAALEAAVPEADGERYAGMWGTFNLRL